MTIREMEQITGLARSNIRFYEKEKLISPVRNPDNGYREYSEEKADYETLDIEQYVTDLNDYWSRNSHVFKMDSLRFFHMWGGPVTWGILTVSCLFLALFSIGQLPAEIPVQWHGGTVSALADKKNYFCFSRCMYHDQICTAPFHPAMAQTKYN